MRVFCAALDIMSCQLSEQGTRSQLRVTWGVSRKFASHLATCHAKRSPSSVKISEPGFIVQLPYDKQGASYFKPVAFTSFAMPAVTDSVPAAKPKRQRSSGAWIGPLPNSCCNTMFCRMFIFSITATCPQICPHSSALTLTRKAAHPLTDASFAPAVHRRCEWEKRAACFVLSV